MSNTLARSWPRGFDFEIFSREALHDAYTHADSDGQKEHVTPFIWRDHTDRYDIRQQARPSNASKYRLTVDTPADFELISLLIEKYDAGNLQDDAIIQIMETHPELHEINAEIEQKKTENWSFLSEFLPKTLLLFLQVSSSLFKIGRCQPKFNFNRLLLLKIKYPNQALLLSPINLFHFRIALFLPSNPIFPDEYNAADYFPLACIAISVEGTIRM